MEAEWIWESEEVGKGLGSEEEGEVQLGCHVCEKNKKKKERNENIKTINIFNHTKYSLTYK